MVEAPGIEPDAPSAKPCRIPRFVGVCGLLQLAGARGLGLTNAPAVVPPGNRARIVETRLVVDLTGARECA